MKWACSSFFSYNRQLLSLEGKIIIPLKASDTVVSNAWLIQAISCQQVCFD